MCLSLGIERVFGIGNYVFRCQLLQLISGHVSLFRATGTCRVIATDSRLRERFVQAALIASE